MVRCLRLETTASGLAEIEAYEMDVKREGQSARHLVVNAHALDYGDADNIRLLLAVAVSAAEGMLEGVG